MSYSTSPTGPQRVVTFNWTLLWRRLRTWSLHLRNSARFRAANTEIMPPVWAQRLHLSWFRLSLIALTVFVFTQKKINFSVTIGDRSVSGEQLAEAGSADATTTMSLLPGTTTTTKVSAPTPVWSPATLEATAVRAYVDRFARVARAEEEKFSIPAPAKMAMALLESTAGTDRAAQEGNNHFPRVRSEQRYTNAWMSWRAHSEYISRRFPELADASVNYQQWIAALMRSGYTQDRDYGNKLLLIIDHYGLAGL